MNTMESDVRVGGDGRLVPAYRLYPVKAVTWATFVGGPLAGGIILSINFRRLGRLAARRHALLWGAVGTIGLVALAFLIPEDWPIPNFGFVAVQTSAMYAIANSLQGGLIKLHVERGGDLASIWGAVGIGAICALVIVVIFVAVVVFSNFQAAQDVVDFNERDEVYFAGDATIEDAQFLGEELTRRGLFGDPYGASAEVEAADGRFTITVVLYKGGWNDPEVESAYTKLAEDLAAARFGRPLTVHLSDDRWKSRNSITIP